MRYQPVAMPCVIQTRYRMAGMAASLYSLRVALVSPCSPSAMRNGIRANGASTHQVSNFSNMQPG